MSRWQRIVTAPARAARAVGRGLLAAGAAIVAPFDLRDAMLFGGTALLGYGLYQVYPPLAYTVPGAIFVAVATFGAR
ncbi:hypothetical protein AB7M45_007819 [Bradyrhizobium elkanii]|uniref:hypothetical protein n=1 Tax=Bradyrhizobium elkanii TaxID=29448 RepID=UPI000F744D28|nr:hypothetical protein [Bradyrhizobium elkanii]MCW2195046.1 hypothetical protein [Bradyrhizobium elkanii]NWL67259.1 hypothetical protein [Bradyrhizobium elkanii]